MNLFKSNTMQSIAIALFTVGTLYSTSCGKTSQTLGSASYYESNVGNSAGNSAASNAANTDSVVGDIPESKKDTDVSTENVASLTVQQELFSGAVKEKDFLLPLATLLGPNALEQVFRPIFGDKPRSALGTKGFFGSFPEQFFTPEERSDLGDFRISGPAPGTTIEQLTSVSISQELNSEYLAALRSFAAGACNGLVTRELKANSETNLLVHKTPLQDEKVNSFFAKVIRRPSTPALFSGVKEYTALTASGIAQSEAAATPQEKEKLLKDSWVSLCVALCTDPRVFLR
jgi:hypothetical protein